MRLYPRTSGDTTIARGQTASAADAGREPLRLWKRGLINKASSERERKWENSWKTQPAVKFARENTAPGVVATHLPPGGRGPRRRGRAGGRRRPASLAAGEKRKKLGGNSICADRPSI